MLIFLVCAAVTILLQFTIPHFSSPYGAAVKARFVERSKTIPEGETGDLPLNEQNLRQWISSYPESARGYASPVLFPLDILFLFALGIALATGSVFFARHAMLVSDVWPVIWWIIPAVYLASDFVEDVLLIGILKNPQRLTARSFSSLALATDIKIKSVTTGFCQIVALGVLAGLKLVF
jgi:hypothetical protein